MKTKININGKETEIELTADQVNHIKKMSQEVTDRIKTFEDVLVDQNMTMDEFLSNCKEDTIDEIAYKKIKLIAKALNEGWYPDWNDTNQYKHYPYFDMSNCSAFYASGASRWRTNNCGSRLVYKSEKLSNFAGKQFNLIYKEYLA